MPGTVKKACQDLLKALYGESILEDLNFKDTPSRMAKAFAELLDGERHTKSRCREILQKVDFPTPYRGIILTPKHTAFSMCPHHMLPVIYEITIAYMPQDDGEISAVAGASKLARIADILAHRAVLQETLTDDIVEVITTAIVPKGVAVIIKGVHMCMQSRGVKTTAPYITDLMTGVFIDKTRLRNELMFLINMYGYNNE